jgi:hypothetical protein
MERHHLLKPFLVMCMGSVPALLYLASILVGLAHGAHWTLMVATSSELFGLKHFGALYNTLRSYSHSFKDLCPRRCNDLWFLPILLWSFGSLSSYMDAILFHLVLIWVYVCSISATVGSYLLSVKLAGYIYDHQVATIQAAALAAGKILTGPQKCIGPQCFRSAGLCLAWVLREYNCNHQKCWVDKVRWAKTGCTISSKDMESSSKLSCNEQTKTI